MNQSHVRQADNNTRFSSSDSQVSGIQTESLVSSYLMSLAEQLMEKHKVEEDVRELEPNGGANNGHAMVADSGVLRDSIIRRDDNDCEMGTGLPPVQSTPSEQLVSDGFATRSSRPVSQGKSKMDITSLEAFPSLGGELSSTGSGGGGFASPSWGGPSTASPAVSATNRVSPMSHGLSKTVSETYTLPQSEQKPGVNISAEVARVKKMTSTAIDSSTSSRTKSTSFVIRGPPAQVTRAKRELLRAVGRKVRKSIWIPSSARSHVIGPKGSRIEPIVSQSACTIDIKKPKGSGQVTDQFDEEDIEVVVEGESSGVEYAIEQINSIVDSVVTEVNVRISGVDKHMAKFVELYAKENCPGVKVVIKQSSCDEGNDLCNVIVRGGRKEVEPAKSNLQNYISQAQSQYVSSSIQMSRQRLRLVQPETVFERCQVMVVGQDYENGQLELFGPKDQIKSCERTITQMTENTKNLHLDIGKAHGKNLAHARSLLKYFTAKRALTKLQDENGVIIEPLNEPENTTVYEIIGSDDASIMAAKKGVVALVNDLPPSYVRSVEGIDATTMGSLVSQLGNKSVDVVLSEDGMGIAVYRRNVAEDEDFGPSEEDISQALSQVEARLGEILKAQSNLTTREIEINEQEAKYLFKAVQQVRSEISNGSNSTPTAVAILDIVSSNKVVIKCSAQKLDELVEKISQAISDARTHELLCSYTTQFTFPSAHVNKLIGKQGANLHKLCEEFDVKIDIERGTGSGTIQGLKKNADAAKHKILNLAQRLADETTIKVEVPNEYHAQLIGPGGKFIKRLMDRYDVYIQVPKMSSEVLSNAEGNSNSREPTPAGGDDLILIRGPSKGVEKTKGEIEELVKYIRDSNYQETIVVPQGALKRIIGRQGETVSNIKNETDTRIDIHHEEESTNDKVSIDISGQKSGVKKAVIAIQEIVKDILDRTEQKISVDLQYHRMIIGPQGSTKKEILSRCGGESECMISVPPADKKDPFVRIAGTRKAVAKAIKEIEAIVTQQQNQIECNIPGIEPDRFGALIGPGGIVKRDIENRLKVQLYVPKRGSQEDVKVTGWDQESVDAAVSEIRKILSSGGGSNAKYHSQVEVPRNLHAELSNRGVFVRQIETEFGVKIDFGKGNVPKNFDIPQAPEAFIKEALAVASKVDAEQLVYHFKPYSDAEIPPSPKHQTNGGSNKPVIWSVGGPDEETVTKAAKIVQKGLDQVQMHDCYGYLWLSKPKLYGRIVGPQGTRINQIRHESGASIAVPPSDAVDGYVSMRGSQAQLEVAKELIKKAVE